MQKLVTKLGLSYKDVQVIPTFSTDVVSREDVRLHQMFMGMEFRLPVISANMDTVTGVKMANAVGMGGGCGALHRFWSIEENVAAYKALEYEAIVSVGLGEKELQRALALREAGATKFCLDVAHGAAMPVVKQTKLLREKLGKGVFLMVGNFATYESIRDFVYHAGEIVDAYKVGIGGGSACTTRTVTGCGVPTLSSILDCARTGYPIVADGGIKEVGDIAKALAAGAKAVMIGNLFAGTDESPGEEVTEDLDVPEPFGFVNVAVAEFYAPPPATPVRSRIIGKKYRGSASQESYEVQGKVAKHRAPEGESFVVDYTGPVADVLQEIEGGLRSSFSYVGALNMEAFYENAQLAVITTNSAGEAPAHGKK